MRTSVPLHPPSLCPRIRRAVHGAESSRRILEVPRGRRGLARRAQSFSPSSGPVRACGRDPRGRRKSIRRTQLLLGHLEGESPPAPPPASRPCWRSLRLKEVFPMSGRAATITISPSAALLVHRLRLSTKPVGASPGDELLPGRAGRWGGRSP